MSVSITSLTCTTNIFTRNFQSIIIGSPFFKNTLHHHTDENITWPSSSQKFSFISVENMLPSPSLPSKLILYITDSTTTTTTTVVLCPSCPVYISKFPCNFSKSLSVHIPHSNHPSSLPNQMYLL
jgi:hypothetical protein